jgi:hypothetical protein
MSATAAAAPLLPRLPDWRRRLTALIIIHHTRPWQLGEHDCCQWAAAGVFAVTGVDLTKDYRDAYHDADGACRLVRRIGGLHAIGALAGPPIAPRAAMEGDIGLVRQARGRSMLGVCGGAHWLIAARVGLLDLPFGAALKVWGVGHA